MSFNPYEQWDEMGVSIMLHHPISIHQAEGLGRMQVALIARIFSEGRVHVEILGDVTIGTAWLKALQAGADPQLGSITSFSTSLTHYNFNCNHEEAGPCDPITSDWWIQPIYNIYIYIYSTYSLILHCKFHAKNVATWYYMCHLLKVLNHQVFI